MKRAFADIPEGQMHYRVEGSGEPVILLHPGVGSSDAFTNAIPYMSGKYLIFWATAIPTPRLINIQCSIMPAACTVLWIALASGK